MQCPRCQNNGTRVVDSRPADEGRAIRRRRECESCRYRFTTFERIERVPLLIVKKNGDREEFNREKILKGIIRSCEKRPVPMDQMEKMVNEIENELRNLGENEVSSTVIGEHVMEKLAEVDDVAYIRFASVYRQFKDIDVFMEEMKELERKKTEKK
ncbi:MAG: transcriptional regulator NrdR [Desemzia incerta]|uniref:Transcriptional repressor NrdR n=1 Tax=Desemzia incerta TaxID=82801 RepID=A0A1I5VYS5_9LACT|nr:transcriptional regulator NrdR [Desemzia incerta]MCI3029376.1 transcriptional regulator NrdR [Desemzia sp. C1]SFQ12688.1 transcriptional repressor NrdR [Desemzia incerta]